MLTVAMTSVMSGLRVWPQWTGDRDRDTDTGTDTGPRVTVSYSLILRRRPSLSSSTLKLTRIFPLMLMSHSFSINVFLILPNIE